MTATFSNLSAPDDAIRLQQFLEGCSDYYELHEGCSTPADAGEYELTAIPSTARPDDLRVFALEGDGGRLDAVLQLLRNYPEPGTWWIGMLVVASELRSRGLGSRLVAHALRVAATEGATAIRLAVSTRNPRAQRFWEAADFRDTNEIRSLKARSGHVDTVRILWRDLMSAAPPSHARVEAG